MLKHNREKIHRRSQVIPIIFLGIRDRLADVSVGGEMHHRNRFVFLEGPGQFTRVRKVPLD